MSDKKPEPAIADLKPFGYAPGQYSNRCLTCHVEFIGDKRAHTCEDCARQNWRIKLEAMMAAPAPTPVAVEAGLVERLIADAELQECWDKFELGMEAPAPLFHKNTAALEHEAASALSSLQAQVEALTRERANIIATKREQMATLTTRAEAAEAEVTRLRQRVEELDAGAGGRHPTLDEAARAAWVLLRCNGYDLDIWTDNSWPDDAERALRNIMAQSSRRP